MEKNVFLFILALISLGSMAQPLPIDFFAKPAQFNSIKISPDGKHYAASVPYGKRTALVIIDRKSKKATYSYYFAENQYIDQYYWVNNERVLFTKYFKLPWQEEPYTDGEIYAGNVDGSRRATIFGHSAGGNQTARATDMNRGSTDAVGEVIHLLPDDPKNVLVSARRFEQKFDSSVIIYKVNVYSGRKKIITRTPFGNMRVVFDVAGKPFIATGINREGKKKKFFYLGTQWKEIEESSPLYNLEPISLNKMGSKLYLKGFSDQKTQAFYEYQIEEKELKKIFQHDEVDILAYIRNTNDDSIVGLEFMPSKVEYHYLDTNDEFAKLHSQLANAFNGYDITITSRTNDQSEMVIFARNDKNPGDFFLFNNKTKSAEEIFRSKRWIKPTEMATKQAISFKTRDEQLIHGYLTLPNQTIAQIPLVTLVHGGPYGERDKWWFDSDVQLLANNGFAVLQVNYRGSGGYGQSFEQVAYRKRSTMIQHDIIDGTKWALALPQIASDKACIMGWSFGGYSALMSPLLEPKLFKCSIAAAGVYDALLQEEDADYSRIDSIAKSAERVYGNDMTLLKKESPISYIDNLQVPVLIVHGGQDERVPPEQAFLLKKALDERNMPYEWLFKEKEGHGFYNEKNVEEFYTKTLEFLNKHLK